jgi:hypothetical protein
LQRALREARGRVVLRVEDAAPHLRKLARAALQEGALAAGGQVLDGPGGELWLVGAEASRAARLLELLERLIAPAAAHILSLERDGARLLAYATGSPAPSQRAAGDGPDLADLDDRLAAMPLSSALRRLQGWPVAGRGKRPAFLRLEPDRPRLGVALGALGQDHDLLYHAAARLAARVLAAIADPAELRGLIGPVAAPRLHMPMPVGPQTQARQPLPPGLLVATIPLAALAEPQALAARQAALTAAGIGLEIEGLDAAALRLLDPAALPDAMLRLRWSPALEAPWAAAAVARLGPQRVVLSGATPAEASRLGTAFLEAEAS